MKKILLSAAVGSLFFTANADQTVVTAHEEPAIVVEQAPEVCECPFGGLYLGLGIGGSFLQNNGSVTTNGAAYQKMDNNVNRFIGTIALGGGKVFNEKFYLGLEGMMDFTKSENKRIANNTFKIKNTAVIPSIGLRLGYVYNCWLIYGKVSASHASTEATVVANNVKLGSAKKFAPALALGVEKAFCKKFTARLEGEYRFESKKDFNETIGGTNYIGSVKGNKGFTVRALVAYNVKI